MPASSRPTARQLAPALAAATTVLLGGAYACADSTAPNPGLRRVDGAPVTVGAGTARTYVLLDDAPGGGPVELGVALSEGALEGLAAPMHMPSQGGGAHAHVDSHEDLLPLPAENPTGYKLVELNWNPGGHEPPGIYDVPHFDFHFYTITAAQRNAIDPVALGEAQFLARSGNLPPEAERAPFHVALAAPGQPVVAVPRMGVHWVDVRSPELQGMLGNPAGFRPFTTTFIYGSWDGRFVFAEPMVTRAFILGRRAASEPAARDSVIPVSTARQYRPAGFHPAAYHVAWDEASREYRVGLQRFARR